MPSRQSIGDSSLPKHHLGSSEISERQERGAQQLSESTITLARPLLGGELTDFARPVSRRSALSANFSNQACGQLVAPSCRSACVVNNCDTSKPFLFLYSLLCQPYFSCTASPASRRGSVHECMLQHQQFTCAYIIR